MKICTKCKKSKPISEYMKHKQQKSGLQPQCNSCLAEWHRGWYSRNLQTQRERAKRKRYKLKLEMITAYGGKCDCCGESEPKFLTIDHIYGGGKNDRGHVSSEGFWGRLRRENWPRDKYALLCFNCNCAKGFFGQCPHNEKLQEVI